MGDRILWLRKRCGCIVIAAGSESFVFESPKIAEVELARSALAQLVSLHFIRREGISHRITELGIAFERSYDSPDQAD